MNGVTLKYGFGVVQGHSKWCRSVDHIRSIAQSLRQQSFLLIATADSAQFSIGPLYCRSRGDSHAVVCV